MHKPWHQIAKLDHADVHWHVAKLKKKALVVFTIENENGRYTSTIEVTGGNSYYQELNGFAELHSFLTPFKRINLYCYNSALNKYLISGKLDSDFTQGKLKYRKAPHMNRPAKSYTYLDKYYTTKKYNYVNMSSKLNSVNYLQLKRLGTKWKNDNLNKPKQPDENQLSLGF